MDLDQIFAGLEQHGRFRDLTNGRIHMYEMGGGDNHTVVVHGMGADQSADEFALQLEKWSEHLHILAVDLLGFGRSARTLEYGPNFAVIVDCVRELMDLEGLRQVNLVGFSMGGWISALLAYESPDRVRRLVMLESAGMNPTHAAGIGDLPTREKLLNWLAPCVKKGTFTSEMADAMCDQILKVAQLPDGHYAQKPLYDQMRTPASRKHWLLQRRLAYIRVPSLVVFGGETPMEPYPTWAAEWEATGGDPSKSSKPWVIPGAQYVLIPSEHYVIWESPDEIASLVTNFLA